jgi:hypothetical protein
MWEGEENMPTVVCLACVVERRKYAENRITPTRVWFGPRHVRAAFVEKVDEEEILLVTLTINKVNKN